jgi:hypothetical protein
LNRREVIARHVAGTDKGNAQWSIECDVFVH